MHTFDHRHSFPPFHKMNSLQEKFATSLYSVVILETTFLALNQQMYGYSTFQVPANEILMDWTWKVKCS